ncbi:MAG TPA: DNA methyltransferase [Gaiella sp.]|nr:DNA methyltransferase [Gaiella sp.]
MAATQEALYGRLDLALSWSEAELPERERTKHVHRLHPYLGKFVPQLVETLLERYVPAGGRVLDPFAGSGTTLVQCLESGYDASGIDVAPFNCLLMEVKTEAHDLARLRRDLGDAYERAAAFEWDGRPQAGASAYVRDWYAPRAAAELLDFRDALERTGSGDVLRVVLARAARSARRTTHFDLDFPRAPQLEPYLCRKHRRVCRPVEEARRFLLRYTRDTLARIEAFAHVRAASARATVLNGDARTLELGATFDAVITSPPYPGLIDYHEQHRYAYELLGLARHDEVELGRPANGLSRSAILGYVEGVAAVLDNARRALAPGAAVCVVVNDRRDLYPEILRRAQLRLEDRLERHVNRRTGLRAGEYFESVLVCRAV